MAEKVMRERKDGTGFSPCSASEENVGKRRCSHVHGGTSFRVEVNKIDNKFKEVVISPEYEELDKREKKEVIKTFIQGLQPVDEEKVKVVLDKLRDM